MYYHCKVYFFLHDYSSIFIKTERNSTNSLATFEALCQWAASALFTVPVTESQNKRLAFWWNDFFKKR